MLVSRKCVRWGLVGIPAASHQPAAQRLTCAGRMHWAGCAPPLPAPPISLPYENGRDFRSPGAAPPLELAGSLEPRDPPTRTRDRLPADMPRSKPLWGRFVAEPDGSISLFLLVVWKQEGYLQHWVQVWAGQCAWVWLQVRAPAHDRLVDVGGRAWAVGGWASVRGMWVSG